MKWYASPGRERLSQRQHVQEDIIKEFKGQNTSQTCDYEVLYQTDKVLEFQRWGIITSSEGCTLSSKL